MKHLLLTTMALLVLAPSAHTQNIEYGSEADLKGIKKIFIDTGTDMKSRERMLKVFKKHAKEIPGVEVLDAPDGADVVLVYKADRETYVGGATTHDYGNGVKTTTPTYRSIALGDGAVIAQGKDERTRLLMSFHGSASYRWTAWPCEQFAKKFVEAWAKANK